MPSRRRSRERALQILFQWDARRMPVDEAVEFFYESLHAEDEDMGRLERDLFMEQLVRAAVSQIDDIDKRIGERSAHWRLDRMPTVDRNILRLATAEMLLGELPPAVIIDEALELARRFSGDESVKFVNGVLDAVKRSIEPPPEPPAAT